MKIIQDFLLGKLAGIFHLKLLLQGDAGFLLGNGEDGALHKRVQHPALDCLVSSRGGAGVKEEHRGLLRPFVGMGEPIKGETRLDWRDALDEAGERAGIQRVSRQLDSLGSCVDFLRHT